MSDLRDRIADALYQWTLAAAGGRRLIPPDEAALRENALARADAVMGVVGPEIASMWDQIDRDQHTAMDAQAALDRIRALHSTREVAPIYPIDSRLGRPGYTECGTCRHRYPCPTLRAIDGSTDE